MQEMTHCRWDLHRGRAALFCESVMEKTTSSREILRQRRVQEHYRRNSVIFYVEVIFKMEQGETYMRGSGLRHSQYLNFHVYWREGLKETSFVREMGIYLCVHIYENVYLASWAIRT